MKNMTYMMIIVFVLSLTVYSCAKKDDSSTSSTTSTFTVKGSM
jgi:ABC-type Fe3+-citrate transport system substrate-binding protein